MARQTQTLANDGDTITIIDTDTYEINGAASIQYGTGGNGTVVMEVSSQSKADGTDDWVQIAMYNQTSGTDARVTSITAAGVCFSEIVGVNKVRARLSGAGNVKVTLTVNMF